MVFDTTTATIMASTTKTTDDVNIFHPDRDAGDGQTYALMRGLASKSDHTARPWRTDYSVYDAQSIQSPLCESP